MISQARGRSALRIGAMTILGAAAFAILFVYSTGRILGAEHADIFIRFDAADGLQRGDAVLHRGVSVGEVKSIDFSDADVVVKVRLTRTVPIGRGAEAAMVAADIFGRQSIVLHDRGGTQPLLSGDTLHGSPPVSLTTRFDDIGERVDNLLSDQMMHGLREVLAGAGRAADGAGTAADEIASFVRTAERVLQAQDQTLAAVTEEAGGLLRNLRTSTDPDSLEDIRSAITLSTANLASATASMDTAATALVRLLAEAESGDGSLAKLLGDPALHDRTVSVLASLERLLDDIRENPKRYVTIRVF